MPCRYNSISAFAGWLLLSLTFVFHFQQGLAQNPMPAGEQKLRILYTNGTAHLGNGQVIDKSAIGFENGKFKLIADITTIRIDRTAYDTIIDISGKHVYPGLIALNTILGLSEIEAVRATNDHTETGSLNPSARALIAYNTDSKVIPTVRSNGVLLAQITPTGGMISGQSSVVELDAWNYEDAAYATDIGVHLNWPSMRVSRRRDQEAEANQRKQSEEQLQNIAKIFSDAKAYAENPGPAEKNLHLEALRGLFNGTKKLFVHCNYVKEIVAAAALCREHGISMVLVGGSDAMMVAELLKAQKIPVIITATHRLPSREDEAIDTPFIFPSRLRDAGIDFAISVPGFWQIRNLAFHAGSAAGYGLTKEEALSAITRSAAAILGIENSVGTLENGKDATFIIADGDIFDMQHANVTAAHIRGKLIDLDSIQKQLNRKYRSKYGLD
jgi:imidazolonepropionase-like amidohydrolase